MAEMVDGKLVKPNAQSTPTGEMVDGKPVMAQSGGIMNAGMAKSAFAEEQDKSPIWQGIKAARGIQKIYEATGHPYLAKGMKNLTDLTDYGYKKLTGFGSGLGQTIYGGMNTIAQYAPEGSLYDQTIGRGIRRGLAISVGAGQSSPEAESAHNLEQFGEYLVEPEFRGAKMPTFFSNAAKTGGIIKRPLAAGARDFTKILPLATAQAGGDFSKSLPVAGGASLFGAAGGAVGAIYDKFAGLTQDIHPDRIAANKFAKTNDYGPVDPTTGERTPMPMDVDPSTRTGNRLLRNTKKGLSSGPMGPAAEDLENRQSNQYGALGEKMGESFGGGNPPLEPIQTGQSGYSALDKRRAGYSGQANQLYEQRRAVTDQLPTQQLPVSRWEMVDSGNVNSQGAPIYMPQRVTTTENFQVPVDRTQLQRTIKPYLDSHGTITEAEKIANPGLRMMDDIVKGPTIVEAEHALEDLSAMFQISKLKTGQQSRTTSQFFGSKAMQEYRAVVDDAFRQHGILDLVNQGRAAVGKQHAIGKLMNQLAGKVDKETAYSPSTLSPVEFFQSLVRRKDTAFPLLRQFQGQVPGEIPKVASTVFQGLLEDAGKGDSSYSSALTARNNFRAMGNQTKNLLFGEKGVRDIDNFLNLGVYLNQNPQPSNTAMHMLMTSRLVTLLTNQSLFAKDVALEYMLGKYMFSTGGALPYMRQITPGRFSINPASMAAAAIFHRLTGIDPKTYSETGRKGKAGAGAGPGANVESTPQLERAGAVERPPLAMNVGSKGASDFWGESPTSSAAVNADGTVNEAIASGNVLPGWMQKAKDFATKPFTSTPTMGGAPMDIADEFQVPQSGWEMGLTAAGALIPPAKGAKALKGALKAGTRMLEGAAPETRLALNGLKSDITAAEVLAEAARGPGKFGGFSKYMERNPTAGEQLMDTSNAKPAISGRPAVPRYDPTTGTRKGYNQRAVDAFANPKVINGLKEYIRRGAAELPQDWYATDPLFKEYQKIWGPRAEEKFFQQMAYQAATSQGASVPDNIKIGSLYNYMHEQGLEFPKLVEMVPGEKPKLNIPKSYGHDKQLGHLRTAETFRDTGAIDALGNPKRASFTENFMGNEDALTADRHFMRLIGMLSEDPRYLKTTADVSRGGKMVKIKPQQLYNEGKLTMQEALGDANMWEDAPNANEYLYLEKMFRDKIARPLKLTVADSQGKAWVGARKLTGMDSPVDTWVNMLRQRVQYTADRLGADPKMILTKFIKGQIPLLQVGGAAAGLGIIGSQAQGNQATKQNAGAMQ